MYTKLDGLTVTFGGLHKLWILKDERVLMLVCSDLGGRSSNLIGPAKGFLRSLNNFFKKLFSKNPFLNAFRRRFVPLTAFITSEVKNTKNFEQIH